jgi:hypothetical protein
MTPKNLKEFLGLSQKHMATLMNEDYLKYRSLQRRTRKPLADAQLLFQYVGNYRLKKGSIKTPLSISASLEPQHLSIYVMEDLQKRVRACKKEKTIYQNKLKKLEAQLAKYNKEFAVVMEIQDAVPKEELDLHDRISLLKRQLMERYTKYYYSILERKLALNWKKIEYDTLLKDIEIINNQKTIS